MYFCCVKYQEVDKVAYTEYPLNLYISPYVI